MSEVLFWACIIAAVIALVDVFISMNPVLLMALYLVLLVITVLLMLRGKR